MKSFCKRCKHPKHTNRKCGHKTKDRFSRLYYIICPCKGR